MTSTNCWRAARAAAAALLWAAFLSTLPAQTSHVLSVTVPPKTAARRGTTLEARIQVQLRPGYHVNSHTPSEEHLIPLRLSWDAAPLEAAGTTYPKPRLEKYQFSEKPISVFSGGFEIVSRFRVPAGAPQGPNLIVGKLRYQACTERLCLPPKTLEVRLPISLQ